MNKSIKPDIKKCNKLFGNMIKTVNRIHRINILELEKISHSRINNYKNANYTFKQIIKSFDLTFNLLENKDPLNAMTILRNTYEEIMFLFSTFIDNKLIVSIETKPGYFRKNVKDNFDD